MNITYCSLNGGQIPDKDDRQFLPLTSCDFGSNPSGGSEFVPVEITLKLFPGISSIHRLYFFFFNILGITNKTGV